jgi:hypothetical protein
VQWEEIKPALASVEGLAAAVDTEVAVLARMGFFDAGGPRVLFYPTRRDVDAARRSAGKLNLPSTMVLRGGFSGLPLRRRSLGLVVAPLPARHDPDVLRSLRRAAGILDDDGLLVLHGPVRRNPLGWGLHLWNVLAHREGGLPSEWDITGWLLRGGFNRVVRIPAGRGSPVTILQASKNLI